MIVVSTIAGWLLQAKVSQRLARPLAWVIAIVGAVLLAWAAWSLLKGSIIRSHDAEVRAQAAERQLDRQAEADGDQLNRQAADGQAKDQLQGVLENAVDHDPRGGNAAAGPGANAVLGELRRRQEASQRR